MVFCCFHDTESTGALRFIFQPFPTQKYKSASKYACGFVHIHNFAYDIVKNAWWKYENYTLMV